MSSQPVTAPATRFAIFLVATLNPSDHSLRAARGLCAHLADPEWATLALWLHRHALEGTPDVLAATLARLRSLQPPPPPGEQPA